MSEQIREQLDRHEDIIGQLRIQQAETTARIRAMEERIDRNQSQIIEHLTRIETKTDTTTQWMNESKGGLKFGRWITVTGLAIGGLIVGAIKYFKGG